MHPFSPEEKNLLREILIFAQKERVKLYLVGGYLRDILLAREKINPDIDFCLKAKAVNFGRKLKIKLKAGFVLLDKERGCCRLVKRINDKVYTLDFTDFRGKALEDDLLHRDFTMNALAAELEQVIAGERNLAGLIIDPYGGKKDLKAKLIRMMNKKSFDEDPLRILRAFSLAAIFDFKISAETIRLIKLKREELSRVSGERIRDELFKILESADAFSYLLAMDRLKVLKVVIPEIEVMRGVKQGPYHHLDVWKHSLETIRQLDNLIRELKRRREIRGYLEEVIAGERRRRALIKLGALLHDVGKPKAKRRKGGKTIFHGHERIGVDFSKNIVQRLKLSNDESDALKKMIFWHLRPGYLADNEEVTPRAIFRYFRDSGLEAVSILLISLADQRATRGPLTTRKSRLRHEKVVLDLIKEYFRRKKEKKPVRLLTGNDLLKQFKLEPSPLIGKILRELEELQAIGKIKTKKEALSAAQTLI